MTDDQIPQALRIAWGAEEPRRRGPARELTHEQIVDMAIEIADADGLSAVTMQRVAKSLDRTTMALYRYVDSKDDLLLLMQDRVMSGAVGLFEVDAADWRAGLRDLALGIRELYRRKPWLLGIRMSMTGVLMPHNLHIADAAFRAMRTLPVPEAEKVSILLNVTLYARGISEMERDIEETSSGVVNPATIGLLREAVAGGDYPDAAAAIGSGALLGIEPEPADPLDDFKNGLDLILSGIAARL